MKTIIQFNLGVVILGLIAIIAFARIANKALNVYSWTKTQETMFKYNGNCHTEMMLDGYKVVIICNR